MCQRLPNISYKIPETTKMEKKEKPEKELVSYELFKPASIFSGNGPFPICCDPCNGRNPELAW